MNELIEKLEQLKKVIRQEDVIVSFLEQKKKTLSDSSLVSKIEKYQCEASDYLKKEIEQSPSFLAYKEKETEVNLFILEINQCFKAIRQEFGCRKEG